jgi:hypothetical protein
LPTVPHPRWAPVRAHFSWMALVDGSTLVSGHIF